MMKRMKLTRAELFTAQMAMWLMWFELQDNVGSKPLQSALIKLHSALSAWDGDGDATLIWTPGGELGSSCPKEIPRKPPAWTAGAWIDRSTITPHVRAGSIHKPEGSHPSGRQRYRGASSHAVPRDESQRA